MRTTTSGLLLILLGVTALAGFLTGNLDRWLSYLFDPARPGLAPVGGGSTSSAAGERRTGTGGVA